MNVASAGIGLSMLLAIGIVATRVASPIQHKELPGHVLQSEDVRSCLELRKRVQLENTSKFTVPYDFRFSDRGPESSINFTNRIVDDAGKDYKPVHYDHGTGLAAADIDGDRKYDLYLVNQLGSSELWKNLGGGRFENITVRAGVGLPDRIKVSASFADIDNDGDQDLFVTSVRGGNVLFENKGDGTFRDISAEAGVGYVGHSSSALFFDYDRDGLLDLLVLNVGRYTSDQKGAGGYFVGLTDAFQGHLHPDRSESCIVYRNMGHNRFRDVTKETGLANTGWSGDATAVDFNNDSFPDLYILNMQGDDHYYENIKGQQFIDKTKAYFPRTPWGSMGVKSFDYNNDGNMDLFVTDMHSDMHFNIPCKALGREKLKSVVPRELMVDYPNSIWGNAFYEGNGDGRFVEVSDKLNVENYWPWGTSVGDVNADGYQDIFITASMNYPYRYGVNSLLLNNGGKAFLDSEFLLGIEPRRDAQTSTPWFTLDCSGIDLNHQLCHEREGLVTVMGALGSRSSVTFDLDDDGDLDIVTNEFNSAPQVLISDLAQRHRIGFTKVELTGLKSNRNGLGARVTVWAGSKRMTQVQDGKSGYLSQSVLPLYFGLGHAQNIDRIDIKWPSGVEQVLAGPLPVNTTINVVEGRPAPRKHGDSDAK